MRGLIVLLHLIGEEGGAIISRIITQLHDIKPLQSDFPRYLI